MKNLYFAALDCGLEATLDAAVLQALGQIADETGYARVSHQTLKTKARCTDKSVRRSIARLSGADPDRALRDGDRENLLVEIQRARGGPRAAAVYLVHWARLAAVAEAYRVARRQIFAGADHALERAQLAGKPATPENCRRAIMCWRDALKAEGYHSTAKQVDRQLVELARAMEGWPDKALGQGAVLSDGAAVDKGGQNSDIVSENSDIVSRNSDIVSTAHSIDSPPQGEPSRVGADARAPAGPDDQVETRAGRFGDGQAAKTGSSLTPQHLAAELSEGRQHRGRIMEALLGSQILEIDGVLWITARSPRQRDHLTSLLSEELTDACFGRRRWQTYQITSKEAS